ncbi:MAG TPA: flagellar hook-basal body complex protein FliE [Thermodesulfobacteriota bacterium]|nr:flagellar hook-basal body complex protein FliE [Thermodesulfobacteriota bacterium]
MDDFSIRGVSVFPLEKGGAAEKAKDPISDFKKILGQSVEQVNGMLSDANDSAREMAAGRLDIHQAMIAMEEAGIAFRLMVQVRNKMISAYEEIMRMQV